MARRKGWPSRRRLFHGAQFAEQFAQLALILAAFFLPAKVLPLVVGLLPIELLLAGHEAGRLLLDLPLVLVLVFSGRIS